MYYVISKTKEHKTAREQDIHRSRNLLVNNIQNALRNEEIFSLFAFNLDN
jgi:hypothetical protein